MFPSTRDQRAFTLVELLVSMVILGAIILLLTQLFNGVLLTTGPSHKHMDADGQARMVLDRIAFDFAGMLRRDDVDYSLAQISGTDSISFYSEVQGYGLSRSVSVVGYRINSQYQLERAAKGMDWSSVSFIPFVSGSQIQTLARPNTLPALSGTDFQVLGDQVFRFQVCYLVTGSTTGMTALTTKPPASRVNLQAIVVGIGVLDGRSRLVVSPAQMQALANTLRDPVDGEEPATVWNNIILRVDRSAAFPPSGMPQAAASAVRIYQRYYYLQ